MGDRPIDESVESLNEVGNTDVPREVDAVMDLVRGDLDNVRRLVEQAAAGQRRELGTNIDDAAVRMQQALAGLGDELAGAFTAAASEIDGLRRHGDGGGAVVESAPAAAVAEESATFEVSSSSAQDAGILENPPPNALIVVDQSVVYTTDEFGRVVRAQAVLTSTVPEQPRNRRAQQAVKGRLPGDHAGHIIARILGGVGDSINLVPMEGRRVNLGQYRQLERAWQRIVDLGGTVEVDIRMIYDDGSSRPAYMEVEYETADEFVSQTITNTPLGEEKV